MFISFKFVKKEEFEVISNSIKPSEDLVDHDVTNLMLNAINEAKLKVDKDLISLSTEPIDYFSVSKKLDVLKVNFKK